MSPELLSRFEPVAREQLKQLIAKALEFMFWAHIVLFHCTDGSIEKPRFSEPTLGTFSLIVWLPSLSWLPNNKSGS